MSETKHTPGPWYTDAIGRIWRRNPSDLYEYGGGVAGDKPVATVWKGWVNEGEVGFPLEANARLIAAAPELLEALRLLLAECEHQAWIGNMPDDRVEFGIARAAIAKAEGVKP